MTPYSQKITSKWVAVFLILSLILSTFISAAPAFADTPAKPQAPQNLRIADPSDVTHNKATFTWDMIGNDTDPQDANDIQVYNADTGGWLAWGNRWTRAVTGLDPNKTYRIYITWNGSSPSDVNNRSNVVEFTTTADTSEYKDAPLAPPSYLKVTALSDNSVTLSWGASPNATGYDVYMNGGWMGGTWSNDSTTFMYTLPGESKFEAGKTYKFEVGAQNPPNPVSKNSNPVILTWGELPAPQGLQVVSATRNTASLGWAPVPGALGYEVYRDGKKAGDTVTNHYVAEELEEGTTYSFAVVALNNLWTSAASESVQVVPGANYNNVTYYMSWAIGARQYQPSDMPVADLTHILYAFADVCWKKFGSDGKACQTDQVPLQNRYVYDGEVVIGDQENDLKTMAEVTAIRDANPHLKVLTSVGGWSWSNNFSNVAKTEVTRRTFANSIVDYIRTYKMDGIDIDWEYPVEGGEESNSRDPEDTVNFPKLMKTVREALDAAGSVDGKYYLLTIASGQGDNFVRNADLGHASQYLDFINIMTYDYAGSWETLANHNAPLYFDPAHPRAATSAPRNNVNGGVLGHLQGGVPNYKLVVGVPFYGKGWQGCPSGEYATCERGSEIGTWEAGIFDFTDVEENYLTDAKYVHTWNEAAKVSSLYSEEDGIFITYNDETTMKYMASMVRKLDIAGTMSWDISADRNLKLNSELAKGLPIDGHVNADALSCSNERRGGGGKQLEAESRLERFGRSNRLRSFRQ
ncbi:GH18 family chitinase [Paenibacillus phyllosphaerae]|uniref:chitinase n=1 Tax=Paenibacillus phyllosphaerae TaxID=274593 RepID=A0A7W5FMA3_9BACL|nr:glycosyl hydrolase family 18 protein [Paenibacillus phyllosphaerae]MBB3110051.1 GH18 family chitinase [Paenibacillus phyllosphaerae]